MVKNAGKIEDGSDNMKKIDYALKNSVFDKDFILIHLCPNRFNLKDREDCESTYQVENNPCEKCWNGELT